MTNKIITWDFIRMYAFDEANGNFLCQSNKIHATFSAASGVATQDVDGNYWTLMERTGIKMFAQLVWDATTTNSGTWTFHGPLYDTFNATGDFIVSTVVKVGSLLVALRQKNADSFVPVFYITAWDDAGTQQWEYAWSPPDTYLESFQAEEMRTDGTNIYWGMEGPRVYSFNCITHNSDPILVIDLLTDSNYYEVTNFNNDYWARFDTSDNSSSLGSQTDGVSWTIQSGTFGIISHQGYASAVPGGSSYALATKQPNSLLGLDLDFNIDMEPNGDKACVLFNFQNFGGTSQTGYRIVWDGTNGGILHSLSGEDWKSQTSGTVVQSGFIPNGSRSRIRVKTTLDTISTLDVWVNGTQVISGQVVTFGGSLVGFGTSGTSARFDNFVHRADSRFDVDLQGIWVDRNYVYAWGSSNESWQHGQYPEDRIWAYKGNKDGSGWVKIGSAPETPAGETVSPSNYRSVSGTGIIINNKYYIYSDNFDRYISSFDINTGAYVKQAIDLQSFSMSALVVPILPPIAPVITASLQQSNLNITVPVSIINSATAPFTYTIDYDDGTTDSFTTSSSTHTFTHTYTDTTPKTIKVQAYTLQPPTSVRDTFDRANSATTLNPASDGGTWAVDFGGVFGITSNTAYNVSAVPGVGPVSGPSVAIARRDVGQAVMEFSIDITRSSTAGGSVLVACYDPIATSCYEVIYDSSSSFGSLNRIASDGHPSLGVSVSFNAWSGGTTSLKLSRTVGGVVTVSQLVSGSWVSKGTFTDTFPLTGTWAGFGTASTSPGADHWDNFVITPTTGPIPLYSNIVLLYPIWVTGSATFGNQRTDFYPRHTAQRSSS